MTCMLSKVIKFSVLYNVTITMHINQSRPSTARQNGLHYLSHSLFFKLGNKNICYNAVSMFCELSTSPVISDGAVSRLGVSYTICDVFLHNFWSP